MRVLHILTRNIDSHRSVSVTLRAKNRFKFGWTLVTPFLSESCGVICRDRVHGD